MQNETPDDYNPLEEEQPEKESAFEPYDDGLKAIMSTFNGREVMHAILSQTGIFKDNTQPDEHRQTFAAGKLNIGIHLQRDIISLAGAEYQMMLNERDQ